MALMGLSMLIYAILDGYDLGVGTLLLGGNDEEKDIMIGSIGPFWDANETWLVLGVGILLVAFPLAHGVILTNLYMPVTVMIIGLILRGVAFDFRVKAQDRLKPFWNKAFFVGSLVTAISQGYMLGSYILGFEMSLTAFAFSMLVGLCVAAAYVLVGSCWLIMKTEDDLQAKAILWAQYSLRMATVGIILVSISTPLVSDRIFDKWFDFPNILLLMPIPIITAALVFALEVILHRLPKPEDKWSWVPFVCVIGIFILCFHGLAYSFYPYIVPDSLTIYEAASSVSSLKIILVGVIIVLPILFAYTMLVYRIFSGKASHLTYN